MVKIIPDPNSKVFFFGKAWIITDQRVFFFNADQNSFTGATYLTNLGEEFLEYRSVVVPFFCCGCVLWVNKASIQHHGICDLKCNNKHQLHVQQGPTS